MELTAVLASECTLPSSPRAVALLTTELAQPEASLRRLNHLFSSDPSLAARLLHDANAPSRQLARCVLNISEALVLIRPDELRALVAQAFLGTTSGSVPGVNLQQFWRYSVNVARLSRSLAGIVHQNQTTAYCVGLLHALGELVLHLRNPGGSQAISTMIAPFDLRRGKAERRAWGYTYAEVSAALARQWSLPTIVVDAINFHETPFDDGGYEPLAAVLHLAAWRARAREFGLGQRELAATFPGEVGVALGMDIDTVLQQDPIDWKAQPNADDLV